MYVIFVPLLGVSSSVVWLFYLCEWQVPSLLTLPPWVPELGYLRVRAPQQLTGIHLVAQGFTQTLGVDYKATFVLVAKMNIVCVLLSVVMNYGWLMSQIDVKDAFLHVDLEEQVYMKLPLEKPQSLDPSLVCYYTN